MMEEQFSVDAAVAQIEALLDGLGQSTNGSRATVEELVRLLMQLYGAGLARVVAILREADADDMVVRLAEDKLVASLLLLHGLHPVDTETRVRKALHRLEREIESHCLEFASIDGGVARIAVVRTGGGAPPAS